MSNDKAIEAAATRAANTIVPAIMACVPSGRKLTAEQWKKMMHAVACAAFEMGFDAGRDAER